MNRDKAIFLIHCALSNYATKLDNMKYEGMKQSKYTWDPDMLKAIEDIIKECGEVQVYVKENLK